MIVVWAASMALFVYALLDVSRTPAAAVRTLPKPLWFPVLLFPLLGPVAWLLSGRPARAPRGVKPARGAPDDDEDFLRGLGRDADDRRRRSRDPRDDEL